MKKLWVDDIRPAPTEEWFVARTITGAIAAISMWHFDEISLDHDIEKNEEENFEAVARYIVAKHWHDKAIGEGVSITRLNTYPKITIHSGNPVGAKYMHEILADAGIKSTYDPSTTLK